MAALLHALRIVHERGFVVLAHVNPLRVEVPEPHRAVCRGRLCVKQELLRDVVVDVARVCGGRLKEPLKDDFDVAVLQFFESGVHVLVQKFPNAGVWLVFLFQDNELVNGIIHKVQF